MKKIVWFVILGAALGIVAGQAAGGVAPPPAPTLTPLDTDEDEFYIGAIWTFGRGAMPALELGYRKVDVDSSGDVAGGALSVSYQIGKGLDKIKLKGIRGQEDLQGELGIGFSLLNNSFLGTLGAQGPYVNGGVDFLMGQGPQAFGGINSIGSYDESTRCPAGFSFSAASRLCE